MRGWPSGLDRHTWLSNRRSLRVAALSLAGFAALLSLAVAWVGFAQIREAAARLTLTTVAVLLIVVILALTARSLRTWLLLRGLHVRVPIAGIAPIYFGANVLAPTPVRAGGIALRLWLLRHNWGVPYHCSVAVLSLEILIDICCLLAIAAVCLAALAPFAAAFATVPLLAVAASSVVLAQRTRHTLFAVLRRYRLSRRAVAWMAFSLRQLRALPLNAVIGAIALAFINRGVEIAGLYFVLNTLAAGLTIFQAAAVHTAGIGAAYLSMMPGGLGGGELGIAGAQLALGVEPATAIVGAVTFRTGSFWLAVLLGFVALPWALTKARPQ